MPHAQPGSPPPTRNNVLSGVVNASTDVRKACNGIKRAASLGVVAIVAGLDPERTVAVAERMAVDVLKGVGFDVDDPHRLAAVLPMMLEATTLVLSVAATQAQDGRFNDAALEQAATLGVATLVEVARSRAVAQMVEPAYPTDMESIVALRMSAAAAMSQVSVEIAEFDFVHTPAECIREAGKVVVKAAMNAAAILAPAQTSPASRLMLTQSLIHSGARVYAAAWKVGAAAEAAKLDAMPPTAREAALDAMSKKSVHALLESIHSRFASAFDAVVLGAREIFSSDEPAPQRRAATVRFG